jgi:hypothetical protein
MQELSGNSKQLGEYNLDSAKGCGSLDEASEARILKF